MSLRYLYRNRNLHPPTQKYSHILITCSGGGRDEVRNEKKEILIWIITMRKIFAVSAFSRIDKKMENSIGSCVRVPKTTLGFDDSPERLMKS